MSRRIIPYSPSLKELARELRNNSTMAEIILWKKLKGKFFLGYDFHRQKPLLDYIVDFYCAELNLVIEIDGYCHQNEVAYMQDVIRQKNLEKCDLHFLRFTDKEVKTQMTNVLRAIEHYIHKFEEHTPNPSQEGNLKALNNPKNVLFEEHTPNLSRKGNLKVLNNPNHIIFEEHTPNPSQEGNLGVQTNSENLNNLGSEI